MNKDAWRGKWVELFGVDPRSLASFRVALAIVLLLDLATRAADLRAMYSDDGVMPVDLVRQFYDGRWCWSLHFLSGSVEYQAGLFAVAGLLAVALLVGFQTRWATIGSWLLLASLHNRAPLLINGGDALLVMLLFWSMFLPLGRRFSLDARRVRTPSPDSPIVSAATVAILAQVFLMYCITGMSKWNDVWFSGNALANVLGYDMFVTPLGVWLRQIPALVRLLTFATLAVETVGPFLLFSPWLTRYARPLAVLSFAALHIGVELTMDVAMFSFASLAALTLFMPSGLWGSAQWRKVAEYWRARAGRINDPLRADIADSTWRRRANRGASGMCCAVFLYVVAYNWAVFSQATMPAGFYLVADMLVLGQRWDMFSQPPNGDFRFVGAARLKDDREVDLLRAGIETSEDIESLDPCASSQRWILYLANLRRDEFRWFAHSTAEYFCREWNRDHGSTEQVVSLDFLLLMRIAGEPQKERIYAQLDLLGSGTYRFLPEHGQWVKDGRWTLRYTSGNLQATGRYRDGLKHGPWLYWYEGGGKMAEGSFEKGAKQGEWKTFESIGTRREKFEAGKKVPLDDPFYDDPFAEPAKALPVENNPFANPFE